MKEKSMAEEMDDLINKLSDLSFEIGTLSCRAHLLEDKADELTGVAEDIGRELKSLERKKRKNENPYPGPESSGPNGTNPYHV